MKRPLQQFVELPSKGEYGQNKAHDDVAAVLDRYGFERIWISRKMTGGRVAQNVERIRWALRCFQWRRQVRPNAVLFLQYTITCWQGALAYRLLDEKLKAKKNLTVVALVHDVAREDVVADRLTNHEQRFFAMCDVILLHSEAMRAFFVRHGVDARKLRIFAAFDYLTDVPMNPLSAEAMDTVNVCGNLSPHKCGCYRALKEIAGVRWKLFGHNFDPRFAASNVEHVGVSPPEELPGQFKHGFGLIWDGDSAETQTGLFGLYQKINHPHKLSLYLAAGVPVIVWEQGGIAEFVRSRRIGLAVASLREIPARIAELSKESYLELRANAQKLGSQMRAGEIVGEAMRNVLDSMVAS